ncbi:CLUMA_CG017426, isoform A [Clunio marinus]|uniref:CLUMA_CG017426, isoform A n=1 Tax=Clunio marinus TaxID=568069 RepID=A0A1J1IXN3_9DIPT|nr:CLUMA_CG017426, isoform A [Clunio marinus]
MLECVKEIESTYVPVDEFLQIESQLKNEWSKIEAIPGISKFHSFHKYSDDMIIWFELVAISPLVTNIKTDITTISYFYYYGSVIDEILQIESQLKNEWSKMEAIPGISKFHSFHKYSDDMIIVKEKGCEDDEIHCFPIFKKGNK